jgi:hypothetical protein
MPTAVFEFDLNSNTNAVMQDLAWDPWTWEVEFSSLLAVALIEAYLWGWVRLKSAR